MTQRIYNWHGMGGIASKSYICGYCGSSLSSEKGFWATRPNNSTMIAEIYICHQCERPTFFDLEDNQTPSALFGRTVKNINDTDVLDLYEEARRCMSSTSYTAAVLACRKLLMHIAVAQGAKWLKFFGVRSLLIG